MKNYMVWDKLFIDKTGKYLISALQIFANVFKEYM